MKVKSADGDTDHEFDAADVLAVDGGTIKITPNQDGGSGAAGGTVTGASVTLKDGRTLKIDPLSAGQVINEVRKLWRL